MATGRPEESPAEGKPQAAQTRPEADASQAIDVEIVWIAGNGQAVRRVVRVAQTATVDDALAALQAPECEALLEAIAQQRLQTAIYGEACDGRRRLFANDRIELLGELAVDPKTARRLRVQRRRGVSPRDKWSRPG